MNELIKIRKQTYSKKWGRYGKKDVLPFWIADMDFETPDFLVKHLIDRANANYFGYTDIPEQIQQKICNWYKKRYDCDIKNGDIVLSTSVLHSYRVILESCLTTNGKIMMFTPIYPPLINIAKKSNVDVIEVPLECKDNNYKIDVKRVRQILNKVPEIEAIVFCNPHNPVGRVWHTKEINSVKEIVQEKNLYLISDEIHGDIIFRKHTFNSVLYNCEPSDKIIVLSSPAKTFNVAGIKGSYAITKNPIIKKKLEESFKINGLSDLDLFAIETLSCLYGNFEESLKWLENLIEILEENYNFLEKIFKNNDRVELIKLEGSYLAWIKIRDSSCKNSEEMRKILRENYYVDVHEGTIFKENNGNFIRVNFACPLEILKEGMVRLTRAMKEKAI
ncbi:aminotransferase class I/II-fold pyridoxal phosphate-dependent enzyme [Enterococcus faecium]|nr:aminotransferase class I/II-fold pyridoxal phosphate-dependent enzyme [Enterococcus faecium]